MATTYSNGANELLERTKDACETVLQAGTQFQEQSARFFSETLRNLNLVQDWQRRGQSAVNQMFSTAQKNAEDAIQAMSHNTRTGMELVQRSVDEPPPADARSASRDRTLEWCSAMFGMGLTNMELALRANRRMLEVFTNLARSGIDAWQQAGAIQSEQARRAVDTVEKSADQASEAFTSA